VKFIRELVDYGDKGFTSTDYAYKNGKPWASCSRPRPTRMPSPAATDRAGWDDNGQPGAEAASGGQQRAGARRRLPPRRCTSRRGCVESGNLASNGKNKSKPSGRHFHPKQKSRPLQADGFFFGRATGQK
jgi:putative lipoprotein